MNRPLGSGSGIMHLGALESAKKLTFYRALAHHQNVIFFPLGNQYLKMTHLYL